nr:hypothetical protein [Leptospiraceae bacterium]
GDPMKFYKSFDYSGRHLAAKTSEDTQLLLKGMRSRISEAGEITDGEVLARLERLMEAFLKKM